MCGNRLKGNPCPSPSLLPTKMVAKRRKYFVCFHGFEKYFCLWPSFWSKTSAPSFSKQHCYAFLNEKIHDEKWWYCSHLSSLSFFKKMGQSRPLFVYFRSFHIPIQMTNIQFEQYKLKKSIDGVLGTRTRGGRMEGADESTEL